MSDRELNSFDLKCLKILTFMLQNDVVDDSIIDTLRELELEYHAVLDKTAILEEQVNIDSKTGLLKYREDYLTTIVKTASRILDRPILIDDFQISYVRFDIDDFSVINNKYGHDNADKILCDIASTIKRNSRPATDYIMRFGGEEFDAILQSTPIRGVPHYLDRIFKGVRRLRYNFDGEEVGITVSAGASNISLRYADLHRVVPEIIKEKYVYLQRCADDALYHAKQSGKDQYKIHDVSVDYKKIRDEYTQSTEHNDA